MAGECIIAYEQRATRFGASDYVAGFPPSNALLTRLDLPTATDGISSKYWEWMTGGAVIGSRSQALSVDANLRTAHFHPTAGWVVLAISTQLEIRTWNSATGEIGATAIDTQSRPGASNSWLAAKFSPDGRFILATCEAGSSAQTVRLRHFDPVTGAIGGAITVPNTVTGQPPSGLRGLVWAHNTLGFAMLDDDDVNVWSFAPTTAIATFVQERDVGGSNSALCIDWHPSVSTTSYIVVGKTDSPYIGKFDVTLTAGVPTAVGTETAPGTNPGSDVTAVAFNSDGSLLVCAVDSPKTYMYPFTTTFGTPWSAPATELGNQRNAVIWVPNDDYVVYGGGGVDDPEVYPAGLTSWGTKVTAFWDTPNAYQNSIDIDPTGGWFMCIDSAGTLEIHEIDDAPAAAQQIELVSFIMVNLTQGATIRLRGSADRAHTSPTYDVTHDAFDDDIPTKLFELIGRKYVKRADIILNTPTTALFWRADITDANQTDTNFVLGHFLASVRVNTVHNFSFGSAPSADPDTTTTQRTDSGTDVFRTRDGRRTFVANFEYVSDVTAFDDVWALCLEGPERFVLFLPDEDDPALNFALGLWGNLVRPFPMPWSMDDAVSFTVEFREGG